MPLSVTRQMRAIMEKPHPISIKAGGQRLRELYQKESLNFEPDKELSQFGFSCYVGSFPDVLQMLQTGRAPALDGTETAFKFGYATLIVAGAQRVEGPPGTVRHAEVLRILIKHGLPLDVEDIVGQTAMHHLTACPRERPEIARILLENGADPNYKNIYAEMPIFATFQHKLLALLDLLMEFGADLDTAEVDGVTPRGCFVQGGPQVSAIVTKWIRKRAGEAAPRDENSKQCARCSKTDSDLKICVKCRITRYCSKECQKADWSTHKKTCQPFTETTTVTLKPFYMPNMEAMRPTADITRSFMGYAVEPSPASHTGGARYPKNCNGKPVIIKAQVPAHFSTQGGPVTPDSRDGPILVYTKKRDLKCMIRREDNPEGYDRLARVVRTRGLNGVKAYFAGEMKSKDELVVKVAEVLAEQPF
ncbi:hypothetical protein C8J56DRAFT_1031581 [Mycena floridula]|nr:hypothetical protein C8J56DRAFT_1017078 [Mycena floridula]KAJ7577301.1 hypothetical protein C8J56DRAFT_1031581 [Mycena floridula]